MELHQANNVSNLLVFLFKSLLGDIESFFSNVKFFLQTFPMIFSTRWNHLWKISNTCDGPILFQNPCRSRNFEGERRISIAEMNATMNRLGMGCGFEDINENASFGAQDLMPLFEEEEPSFDEINETFKVFDVNEDGFIDASELQRVVCSLELKQRYELGECERMIKAFDSDGDGLIDFQDFVKLMEICLC